MAGYADVVPVPQTSVRWPRVPVCLDSQVACVRLRRRDVIHLSRVILLGLSNLFIWIFYRINVT